MKTILITGFDPFGGEPINPAWEAVKTMDGYTDGDYKVVTQMVPTIRYKSVDTVKAAAEQCQPDFILCVGQAGGRPNITVERVAINQDDARIPDNEGAQPIDRTIFAEGPAAYFATLPIKAMVQNMKAAGIPAAVSNTAGTFVCNHIMYGALHFAATQQPSLKAGFVHIPYVPMQTVDKPTMPSMSVADIVTGLTILIETGINVDQDVKVTGGAVC